MELNMTSSTDTQIQTTIIDEKSIIDEFTPTYSRETTGCVGVLDEITHEGLALCAIEKQVEEEITKTIEDKSLDDILTDDHDIVDSIEQASVDNPLQTATTITIQTPTYHIIECKICFESENTKCHLCICENSTGLCETCANQYLKSKIENSEYPIKCPFPECRRLIPDATIEHNLDDYLKKEFVDLQAKATIELCQKCQEPKHRGLCTKNNKRFVKSVRKNGYKCCPKCYRWIEKNGGCNHMTCVCGNSFCYVCGDQSCRCHLKLAVVSRMRRRCTIM